MVRPAPLHAAAGAAACGRRAGITHALTRLATARAAGKGRGGAGSGACGRRGQRKGNRGAGTRCPAAWHCHAVPPGAAQQGSRRRKLVGRPSPVERRRQRCPPDGHVHVGCCSSSGPGVGLVGGWGRAEGQGCPSSPCGDSPGAQAHVWPVLMLPCQPLGHQECKEGGPEQPGSPHSRGVQVPSKEARCVRFIYT